MFNYVNEGRHRPFQFSFITGEWIFFFSSVKFDVDNSIVLRGTHYLWIPL
ncbi:hypothetical protein AW03_039280 [Bacillus subtilis HJ5]|nr:hypothetical protein AW03_039280 [Bacillus subtilis HJ5]